MYRDIRHNKLLLVSRRWSSKGSNTCDKHFFNFFPGSIKIENDDSFSWDNMLYRIFRKHANHTGYSSLSVKLEWEVLKKALIHRPKIIHFWFADHDYHYTSYIARLIGAKIVGNFFFSIKNLKDVCQTKNI